MRTLFILLLLLQSTTAVSQILALDLVSRYPSGAAMARQSRYPVITRDGRFVLFRSRDRDLFASGVAPQFEQYFLRDRQLGTVSLVSANASGQPMDGLEYGADVSDDGNTVVFGTAAANILPIPPTKSARAYVVDRRTGNIRLLRGTATDDLIGGQIVLSGDGRYALSVCEAPVGSNAFYVFCRIDLQTGVEVIATRDLAGNPAGPNLGVFARMSKDGNSVVYGIDGQVLHHDLRTGVVSLVSRSISGAPGNNLSYLSRVNFDGRYVVYSSSATDLFQGLPPGALIQNQVYLWDRNTQRNELLSKREDGLLCQGMGCQDPDISDDGRYVVFRNDGPAFSFDPFNYYSQALLLDRRRPGVFKTASVNLAGQVANFGALLDPGPCSMFCVEVEFAPRISGNGRFVAYQSESTNLVAGATSQVHRIYVARVQADPVSHSLPMSTTVSMLLIFGVIGLGVRSLAKPS